MAFKQIAPSRQVVPVRDTFCTVDVRKDNVEPFPLDSPLVTSLLFLKWLLWVLYFHRRFMSLPAVGCCTTASFWTAWSLFLAEVCAFLPPFLFQLDLALYLVYGNQSCRRQKTRLVGDLAPTVDVLITCCGEDVDLIMDTVVAAASQDYPPHSYRVFVLDDARSPALERAVTTYNNNNNNNNNHHRNRNRKVTKADVIYLSRTKRPGTPHYFKAGNLRFGISESAKLGVKSDFIAALDSDAIAEPDWLRKTVPHLLLDDNLALVNSAQVPYNLPQHDILGQGSASSNDWVDALRDNIGALTCYGSGYVLRRSALNDIGGWPQADVGEDIFCGFLLAGHGWGIASCGEVLQRDLTPGSMEALVKQRIRWMDGDLHLVKEFGFFLPGLDPCSKRTPAQRISAVLNSVRLFRAVTDSVFPLVMASLLCIRDQPGGSADGNAAEGYQMLKSVYLATILADKLTSIFMFGGLSGLTSNELWLSPFKAISVGRFCLSERLPTFQPTSTVISAADERSARRRRPLSDRLLTPQALVSLLYTSLATISFAVFLHRLHALERSVFPGHLAFYAAGVLVWLLECIVKMSMPLRYMIWPPTVPERKNLLKKDSSGFSRPTNTQSLLSEGKTEIPWLDALQVLVILYVDWGLPALRG